MEAAAAAAVTHVVDGILQVQDPVLQRVADVVLGVAGRGDLFVKRSLHQLLVLEGEVGQRWPLFLKPPRPTPPRPAPPTLMRIFLRSW